jgi:hypothetical protein
VSRASRLGALALAFGLAAAFASWNPLAAPFGLVVGLASAVISLRALAAGARKLLSVGALVVSLLAAVVSAVVLAQTAGIGRRPEEQTIVPVPERAEVEAQLDAAAERTREARERAAKELETVEPGRAPEEPKR